MEHTHYLQAASIITDLNAESLHIMGLAWQQCKQAAANQKESPFAVNCVYLQAQWRMVSQRRRYFSMLEEHRRNAAAVVIQARWHGRKQRLIFLMQRCSAVAIQARWRGHAALTRSAARTET